MSSAAAAFSTKSTACFNFNVFKEQEEPKSGNNEEEEETASTTITKPLLAARIRLPVSVSLREAVDTVGSEHLDTQHFSRKINRIRCANIAISLSLLDTPLAELHDDETPVMNGELISIFFGNKSATGKKSGSLVASSSSVDLVSAEERCQGNCNLFVSLRIPNSLTVVSDYRHFQASSTDSFKSLFCRAISEFEHQGQLDAEVSRALKEVPVSVELSDVSASDNPSGPKLSKVKADLSAMCGITTEIKKPYVRFVPASLGHTKRVSLSSSEVVAQLLASQNTKVIPERFVPKTDGLRQLPFDQRLFNFVVDLYKDGDLGVSPDRLDLLKSLTQATRDALLHITGGELKQSDIPARFRIDFSRENSRDRVKRSQEKMRGLAQNLLTSMNNASGILALKSWESFHDDLVSLHSLLLDTASRMQQKSERMQISRQKSTSTVADNLKNLKAIRAVKVLRPKYVELNQKLAQLDEYQHLIFDAHEIDHWDPPPNVSTRSHGESTEETDEARRKRRQRFREGMEFTFPVRSFQYHPGGRLPILCAVWKIKTNDAGDDCDETGTLRCQARIQEELPKYCTRLQWKSFIDRFGDMFGGSVPISVLNLMYKELVGDSTAAPDKEREQRALLYVMSDSDNDYWPDLRAAINGRSDQYAAFYKTAEDVIDQITGATPYRHGTQRVLTADNASLVSIPALYARIIDRMVRSPDMKDEPLPCPKLLEISCCPQYPSRITASRYTGRFNLSRKILSATMRKQNVDSHYNHKLNQYVNEFISELNGLVYKEHTNLVKPSTENQLCMSKGAMKISVDDKAAVPIGEPGRPVRTNVRKLTASLSVGDERPEAMDHDFHRANLRPSVGLFIQSPDTVSSSWRKGIVAVSLKDAATQHSTAMRHCVELESQCRSLIAADDDLLAAKDLIIEQAQLEDEKYTNKPYILAVRSDGGSDRNPKNASVLLAYVHLWRKLDLDILVVYVTAADVSHVNEVEGVMPVANLALQNQAYARTAMTPEMEKRFKNANSGKAIRETIEKQPTQAEQDAVRQAWRLSIEPARSNLEGRLSNVVYNEDSVKIFPPAGDHSIEEAYTYLAETIDSTLDKDKTTWAEIEKNNHAFTEFKRLHCKVGRYHAEIKKCGRKECHVCKPVRMPSSIWKELDARPQLIPLPTPDLERSKEDNITRYKSYDELKTKVTHPRHRPSYTPPSKPSREALAHDKEVSSKTKKDTEGAIQESSSTAKSGRTKLPTSLWHNNCIRSYVKCSNCQRPRVIYAWRSSDPLVNWDRLLEELDGVTSETSYEYTCGDQLFGLNEDPVLHPSDLDVFHVKTAVTCGMSVQTQYFVDKKGFPRVCIHCGSAAELASADEIKKAASSEAKATYPICSACVGSGKKPVERGRRNKTSGHGGKRKMGEFYQSATKDSMKKRKPPPSTAASSMNPEKLFSEKKAEQFRRRDGKNETKKPTSEEAEMADMLGCGDDWQIRDVPGDGNCGYTAIMMGLQCFGVLESENTATIGFRKALRKFAEENIDRILSVDEPVCINRNNSVYDTIRRGKDQYDELVLDGIFPSGSAAGAVHFGEGGSSKAVLPLQYWLDAPYHIPLIVLKYGVTIVCYQVTTVGGEDQEDGKMTSVYSYENGKVQAKDTNGIAFPDPQQVANETIHIVFHTSGRHFMYLEPITTAAATTMSSM